MSETVKKTRIEALDVLRGLTVALMILVNNAGDSYPFLHHKPWNGITPCDMVFPFFIFIMGASVYLSLYNRQFVPSREVFARIFKRTACIILVCWGIFWFARALKGDFLPFDHFRLTGVLVRIALTYCVVATLALCVKHSHLPWIAAGLLVLYGILLLCFDGYNNSTDNIIARLDRFVLGEKHLYTKAPVDPEGLFGLIPSVAHGIIGFMCGKMLRSDMELMPKMRKIALVGLALLVAGYLISPFLPLNKRIWSPSFVLVSCGYAQILLAIAMYLIDYKGCRSWTMPFKVFGTNALFVYVLSELLSVVFGVTGIGWKCMSFLRGTFNCIEFADLCYAILIVSLNYCVALLLYRKNIRIKI